MNAGAFHVVLVNEIGIKKRGFAMDRDPTVQVWNQPILKYETQYFPKNSVSPNTSDDVRREVAVRTTITYANELYDTDVEEDEDDTHAKASYEPVLGTDQQKYRTRTYEYVLQLDIHDRIIGGDWTGGDAHPDMIWKHQFGLPTVTTEKNGDSDDWRALKEIIKIQATL
jgi:hypothetical protein